MSGGSMVHEENEGFLERAERALDAVVEAVADAVSSVWNRIRNAVKTIFGTYEDLHGEDIDNPAEEERKRRDAAAAGIRELLGDDPLEAIRTASANGVREEMVKMLVERISGALGIVPPPVLAIRRLTGVQSGWSGYFDGNGVTVNRKSVVKRPMSNDDAAELLDTILHELYHGFQHAAINDPHRFGVSRKQAKIWRDSFNNYVSPEQNMELYAAQPVEESARRFAAAVVMAVA